MATKFKIDDLTAEQLAWLAGLFQAEAYFHYDKRVRAKTPKEDYTPPPPRSFSVAKATFLKFESK